MKVYPAYEQSPQPPIMGEYEKNKIAFLSYVWFPHYWELGGTASEKSAGLLGTVLSPGRDLLRAATLR